MGNCLGSNSTDANASTHNQSTTSPSTTATTTTRPSTYTSEISKNSSYGGGISATTGSSASQSRFSVAASDDTGSTGEILPSPNLKIYTFADLKNATRNFKSNTVLGVGGFGTVFKGWVDEKTLAPAKFGSGMTVAIKKLNHESMQGFEEWQQLLRPLEGKSRS